MIGKWNVLQREDWFYLKTQIVHIICWMLCQKKLWTNNRRCYSNYSLKRKLKTNLVFARKTNAISNFEKRFFGSFNNIVFLFSPAEARIWSPARAARTPWRRSNDDDCRWSAGDSACPSVPRIVPRACAPAAPCTPGRSPSWRAPARTRKPTFPRTPPLCTPALSRQT